MATVIHICIFKKKKAVKIVPVVPTVVLVVSLSLIQEYK